MSRVARLVVRFLIPSFALAGLSFIWQPHDALARERSNPADALVQQALQAEAAGTADERAALLEAALGKSPGNAAVRWHTGHVRYEGRWLKFDELAAKTQDDPRLVRYRNRREETPDTAAGHLELANWCAKQRLADQERAHLNRLLQLDPEHLEARERLGFQRVDGQWVSAQEIIQAQAAAGSAAADLARWQPTVERIVADLRSDSPRRRQQAQKRWDALTDSAAIGALEVIFASGDEASTQMLIAKLATFDGHAASLALARQAVFAPTERARLDAADKLASRPEEGYVPTLLAALYTPLQTRTEVYREPTGRLVQLQVVAREGRDRREVQVTRTDYRGSLGQGGTQRAAEDATEREQEQQQQIIQQNEMTAELNRRVSSALVAATGQGAAYTPEQWWQWWNQKNEVFIAGEKPVLARVETRRVDVSQEAVASSSEGGVGGGGSSESLDCLAAGTPVWTDRGAVAIDEIQIGDRVLSRHPESGELAYKPVLRTTVRPASKLVRIYANGQTIVASGGHPFWVSGEGWVKARLLQAGQRLHGVDGTVTIESVEPGSHEQTYNLVAADFHTYFSGEARVLNHDNTVREPTERVVPGLVKQ
jgi:hypothetical protein